MKKQIEIEKRETMPIPSSGQYFVDKSVPYEQMSKLHKLAVDRFGGDLERALDYIFTNLPAEEQDAYAENVTETDLQALRHLLLTGAELKLGKKGIQKIVDIEFGLAHMEMTQQQVLEATKNPFVPKLWMWIGVLLAASVVVGVIAGLGNLFFPDERLAETVATVLGIGATFPVYKVAEFLLKSIRFRKVKRELQKQKGNT